MPPSELADGGVPPTRTDISPSNRQTRFVEDELRPTGPATDAQRQAWARCTGQEPSSTTGRQPCWNIRSSPTPHSHGRGPEQSRGKTTRRRQRVGMGCRKGLSGNCLSGRPDQVRERDIDEPTTLRWPGPSRVRIWVRFRRSLGSHRRCLFLGVRPMYERSAPRKRPPRTPGTFDGVSGRVGQRRIWPQDTRRLLRARSRIPNPTACNRPPVLALRRPGAH